jgi:hypothetical protein
MRSQRKSEEKIDSAGGYFRGLPRFAKVNPRASAEQRSWLAHLRASLRSGPGAITRASSNASAAAISQSTLSGELCVSLLIARSNFLRQLEPVGKSAKPDLGSRELKRFEAIAWSDRSFRLHGQVLE